MNYNSIQHPNQLTAVLEVGKFHVDTTANADKPTIEFRYKVGRVRFDLARNATLAELAEQVCILSEKHGGMPLSVKIEVAVQKPH
jgi:hypothetical protein